MQNDLRFSDKRASDRMSETVLEWIGRTFESMEKWKVTARDVFFTSNGDSNVSRNRVASIVRTYFIDTPLSPEDVKRWNADFEKTETVRVSPPKVTQSNATYVDWLYISDYLLLACASLSEELEEENQRRETEYLGVMTSYKIRLVVHEARERMRNDSAWTDEDVLASVQDLHSKASMANIKEARRLEKADVLHDLPKEPVPAAPMPRYTPLYF